MKLLAVVLILVTATVGFSKSKDKNKRTVSSDKELNFSWISCSDGFYKLQSHEALKSKDSQANEALKLDYMNTRDVEKAEYNLSKWTPIKKFEVKTLKTIFIDKQLITVCEGTEYVLTEMKQLNIDVANLRSTDKNFDFSIHYGVGEEDRQWFLCRSIIHKGKYNKCE